MLLLFAPALFALTLATTAPAPTAPDAAVLAKLLNEFLAGASRDDPAAHERFWADDVIYTGSAGRRRGKSEIMSDVRATPPHEPGDPSTVFTAEDVRVQQYGDAALVAFRLVATTTSRDSTHVAHYLDTGFFVKRGGRWQAVGWQATVQPER
ncbi:MAG TPA: nuclear transport factor 2 family protein [Candidatus Acidoferrales bacterium]|nr:nuclear transport factor 2 family protein [Candidatus Acidoferrales bacterium]